MNGWMEECRPNHLSYSSSKRWGGVMVGRREAERKKQMDRHHHPHPSMGGWCGDYLSPSGLWRHTFACTSPFGKNGEKVKGWGWGGGFGVESSGMNGREKWRGEEGWMTLWRKDLDEEWMEGEEREGMKDEEEGRRREREGGAESSAVDGAWRSVRGRVIRGPKMIFFNLDFGE